MADADKTQSGDGLASQLSGPFKGLGELMLWWDEYDRHARFAPAALAVSPLAVAVLSSKMDPASLEAAGLAAFVQVTLTALFAHTGRAQGDLDERSMRNDGDLPMQRWLCPYNRERSRAQVQLWHAALKNVTGIHYPADETCAEYRRLGRDAFVALQTELRAGSSDQDQRPLHRIHQEEYGFARNLVGLLYLWAFTIAIGLFVTWYNAAFNGSSPAFLIVQMVIAACWVVVWVYSDYFEINGAERLTESLLNRAVAVFHEDDPAGFAAAAGATPAPAVEHPSGSAERCELCGGRWSGGDVPSRPWPAHRMRS